MICDALNAEVLITSAKEASAKGAAISAAIMTGIIKSVDDVKDRYITVDTVLHPDHKNALIYDELYQIYKKSQASMNDFWDWRFAQRKKA
jgi:sugar (pentulose or hexulose) kinase